MKYKLIKSYPGSPELGYESIDDHSRYPEFWEPAKEPLITTIDGTPIYEGDTYFVVFTNKCTGAPNRYVSNGPFKAELISSQEFSKTAKYFLTYEDTTYYISNHKPVLSVNDVLSVRTNSTVVGAILLKLLDIAKSKI